MPQNNRFIPISGTTNFRHMGEYPAARGRKTRGELLFRSGYFELATKEDIDRFTKLNIGTVFDLRSPKEISKHPLKLPRELPPKIIELDLLSNAGPASTRDVSAKDVSAKIKSTYASMVKNSADLFRTFFSQLVKSESAVLMLCAFGKDRTGIASALFLAALGVPRQVILEDYLLSAKAYADFSAALARIKYLMGSEERIYDPATIEPLLIVQEDYFDVFWETLQTTAGSSDAFLEQYVGISPATLKDLQEIFTK